MGWGEVAIISIWVSAIHLSFAIVGGINPRPMRIGGVLGLALYVAGSLLNPASEFQRKTWKERPENCGQLYTGGLFRYAMHINYFGEQVLFTGYAVITGSVWTVIVPVLMMAGFLFFNIPGLDAYLKKRYGEEFTAYAARTRKFVPFLY
jgi:steroid 5-alpha reductase family enzyme